MAAGGRPMPTGRCFDPGRMQTTRYRYRGTAIPNPWASRTRHRRPTWLVESRMPGNGHVRLGRLAAETDRPKRRHRAAARPHNLVHDPAFLVMAWERVAGNTGARTPGVDRATVAGSSPG